ncbi:heparinase II/III family protein [Imhoffiella purpurea]|uniref:Phosphopantothenoylcysteine synthetase/decarboxylase n=1 Tax=Imhoffiella purpurea TaxID=1249627 RepID=W9V630_9GAMM|nr:alginate lyase family protein [Imhoffiella purpurea]EXJ15008.1 Phosphopantothenoylcysteine synthetase/decarboxylase [Imhoffiella purpurea]
MLVRQLALFLPTMHYLRWRQLYWRFYLLGSRATRRARPLPPSIGVCQLLLVAPIKRCPGWLGDGFRFLNRTVPSSPIPWHAADLPKLWLYNLHYFDYLHQPGMSPDRGVALIRDWIAQNPPYRGNGWEPYPISLRIVNWLKFMNRQMLGQDMLELMAVSLFEQTRHLRRSLEYHLLANHLFKNGVALLFAGACLRGGDEPGEWYRKGAEILRAEIAEQVLPDGGHFERSPMYHAIVLEDVLDCLNLVALQGRAGVTSMPGACGDGRSDPNLAGLLRATAEQMLRFLSDSVHPDGTLPRFNDTAEGIAPSLDQLWEYATRLQVAVPERPAAGSSASSATDGTSRIIEKPDFGLATLSAGTWRCVIDCGAIGPDYQPGHAHCDTLSYELTWNGRLVAVNAGTFEYAGSERNGFRRTSAHNTLELDGEEQHEIWATFRVARRGYPQEIRAWEEAGGRVCFSGKHTGYRRLPGRPVHERRVSLSNDCLRVEDRIASRRCHQAVSRLHLHPDVLVLACDGKTARLSVDGKCLVMEVEEGVLSADTYAFSREFGLKEAATVLTVSKQLQSGSHIAYRLRSA